MKTFLSLRCWQIGALFCALFCAQFATAQTPAKLDPPVAPTVSGKFTGNGKNAALKYVTVEEHEPFSGKEAIRLIFTEKDPKAVKKPSFDAVFGKLGSALILSVFHDGGIFGCEVAHSAHKKQGFSSIGVIEMTEFKFEGGNVSGHVSTGKEQDAFGDKWDVDLTFAAPLPPALRNKPAAAKPVASAPATAKEEKEEEPAAPAGPAIPARKLPLPKDAADVQFKSVVNQIQFSSARAVEPVAKEFSANLKQQGWKDSSGSMMGKNNAILRREQGAAKLTIMVQPAGTGCTVKVFTEGLDWSGADEAPAAAASPRKSTEAPSADDIEKEAQKQIREALKGIPGL